MVWKICQSLFKFSFHQSQVNHTLFFRRSSTWKLAILIVYLDNIIMTSDDSEKIKKLKVKLAKEFEIKDLDTLHYFLGVEVARSKEEI